MEEAIDLLVAYPDVFMAADPEGEIAMEYVEGKRIWRSDDIMKEVGFDGGLSFEKNPESEEGDQFA